MLNSKLFNYVDLICKICRFINSCTMLFYFKDIFNFFHLFCMKKSFQELIINVTLFNHELIHILKKLSSSALAGLACNSCSSFMRARRNHLQSVYEVTTLYTNRDVALPRRLILSPHPTLPASPLFYYRIFCYVI